MTYSYRFLFCVVRSMSSVNNFPFITSWKLQGQLLPFWFKALIYIVKSITSSSSWASWTQSNMQKKKFSLIPHMWKIINAWLWWPWSPLQKLWNSWPWVRISGFKVGLIWPNSEYILNLKKSSLLSYIEKNWMHCYYVHKALYLNYKILQPLGQRFRPFR